MKIHIRITGVAVAAFAAMTLANASAQTTLVDEDFQSPAFNNGTRTNSATPLAFPGWVFQDSTIASRNESQSDFPGDASFPGASQGLQFEYNAKWARYNITHNWASSDYYILTINASPQSWNGTQTRYIRPSLREQDGTVLWAPGEDSTTVVPIYDNFGNETWQDNPQLTFTYAIDARLFSGAGVTEGSPLQLEINSSGFRGLYFDNVKLTVQPTVEDTTPPSPDPLTWASVPAVTDYGVVSMTTNPASDLSGVEYYFENITKGTNSGWSTSDTWVEGALDPETTYTYRVKARDQSFNQNESTTWSTEQSVTTPAVPLGNLYITGFQSPVFNNGTSFPGFSGWTYQDGTVKSVRPSDLPGDTSYTSPKQAIQFEYNGRWARINISHNWAPSDVYVLKVNASPLSWNGGQQRWIRPSLRQQNGTVLWAAPEDATTAVPLYNNFGATTWQASPELTFTFEIPASAFSTGAPGQPLQLEMNSSGFRGLYIDNVQFGFKTTTVTSIARNDDNPTNKTEVSWNVTFEDPVTGLTASNFALTGSLAGSSLITDVQPAAAPTAPPGGPSYLQVVVETGNAYTVTATTAGCGTLGLKLDNGDGVSPKITNAPFEDEDQAYDIDTEPPVISCAKQIVVTVPEGQSATVNYAPTAYDACEDSNPEVTCDPPSGSSFGVGNHVVECTATDSAGNVGIASFNVVVLVQQPANSDRFLDSVSVRGDVAAAGDGIGPDAVILGINNAFLNKNGEVVFDASLQGNGANNSAVFHRPAGGTPAPVAVKGASFGAGAYGNFSHLSLNDAGDIGFQSLTSGNLPGHFAGPGAGPVANSARRLGASPSGGVYNGLYQPALASNGELLTPAALLLGNGGVTSLNDSVITSSAGTVVAREGSPSGIGAINHGQFLARVVASDADGRYAFPSLISESPPTGGNAGIFVGQLGGSPTLAVRKGDAAAGTPGTFSSFLGESVNSDGEIALRAFAIGGGITAADNEGIWTNSGNASAPPVLVAREGDVAPCIAGGMVAFSSFGTIYMGDDGSVCFLAYLKDSDAAPFAMVNASNDASIWLWRNGALDLIVREGDLANSTDGAVVGRIVDFDSNGDAAGGNGIAYSVEFAPISGDTTSRTNQAVYVDRGGEDLAPVLVLRRGDKFTVGEDEVDVLSLRISSAQAYTPSGSTGGFGRAINGDGDVLLNVGFTGSKSGIFVLGSPLVVLPPVEEEF